MTKIKRVKKLPEVSVAQNSGHLIPWRTGNQLIKLTNFKCRTWNNSETQWKGSAIKCFHLVLMETVLWFSKSSLLKKTNVFKKA